MSQIFFFSLTSIFPSLGCASLEWIIDSSIKLIMNWTINLDEDVYFQILNKNVQLSPHKPFFLLVYCLPFQFNDFVLLACFGTLITSWGSHPWPSFTSIQFAFLKSFLLRQGLYIKAHLKTMDLKIAFLKQFYTVW